MDASLQRGQGSKGHVNQAWVILLKRANTHTPTLSTSYRAKGRGGEGEHHPQKCPLFSYKLCPGKWGKPVNGTNKTHWEFLRVRLNRPSWFQRLSLMPRWCGEPDRALADERQRSACLHPARCLHAEKRQSTEEQSHQFNLDQFSSYMYVYKQSWKPEFSTFSPKSHILFPDGCHRTCCCGGSGGRKRGVKDEAYISHISCCF